MDNLQIAMETSVKDELICPICLEVYNVPIILPCSHILCRDCTNQLFDFNFVRCPVCRDRSYVTGGIETLPRVITLENIIERIRRDSEEETEDEGDEDPESVVCQMCSGRPRRAKRSCQDCNASYCSHCLQLSHPSRPPFTDHKLVEPTEQPRQKIVVCGEHQEKATVFCIDCKLIGCTICFQLDTHKGHQVLPIDQAFEPCKTVLLDSLKKLENNQSSIADSLKIQQQHILDIQQSADKRRSMIKAECESLVAEIRIKEKYFIADLDYELRHKTTTIEEVSNEYKLQLVKLQKISQYATEVLKEEDPASLLQLIGTVNDRVQSSIVDMNTFSQVPPDSYDLKQKAVDFRRERDMLKRLNYLSPPSVPVIDVAKCARSWNKVMLVITTVPNEVVDSYTVCYCSEDENRRLEQKAQSFKAPIDSTEPAMPAVLEITGLDSGVTYYFGVKAFNAGGESNSSDVVCCMTLDSIDIALPAPETEQTLCRTFTTSVQIYSTTPSLHRENGEVKYFLLYRDSSQVPYVRAWRSKLMSSHGPLEHRVFGLDPNTRYEFLVMVSNSNGAFRTSSSVVLKTENAV